MGKDVIESVLGAYPGDLDLNELWNMKMTDMREYVLDHYPESLLFRMTRFTNFSTTLCAGYVRSNTTDVVGIKNFSRRFLDGTPAR